MALFEIKILVWAENENDAIERLEDMNAGGEEGVIQKINTEEIIKVIDL